MDGTHAAARAGARPTLDDRSLLEGLLEGPAPRPAWAAPASLRAARARCAAAPAWTTVSRRAGRPALAAATLLLAGGLVAASVGVAPARAETGGATPAAAALVAAPAASPQAALARGALAGLRVAPAGDVALLARLMAAPAPSRADTALLATMLASEPEDVPAAVVAAPPAAVSFATVARLPAAALSYSAAVRQLPMITLADNVPPPAPRVVAATAQQQPAPPGYVAPPGYRDGQYLGGQYPGLAPGQFPPTTARPTTTRPAAARPATAPAVYVVRAGDTLSAIALRFYGDVRYAPRIWDANYRVIGANPNAIFVGQRLTLPGLTVQVARPATPLPARGPIAQRSNYTIQPRDFLRWISQRAYGNEMLWPEIYNANRRVLGPNPDLIYPGVTVYIP